jgi:hypothetical protein
MMEMFAHLRLDLWYFVLVVLQIDDGPQCCVAENRVDWNYMICWLRTKLFRQFFQSATIHKIRYGPRAMKISLMTSSCFMSLTFSDV